MPVAWQPARAVLVRIACAAAVVVAAAAWVVLGSDRASAQVPVPIPPPGYTVIANGIHTQGTVFVPTLADASHDGVPDILVEIVALPTTTGTWTAQARIVRLNPLGGSGRIEIVAAVPGSPDVVSFGYEAGSWPSTFDLLATVSGGAYVVEIQTAQPSPMTIFGALHQPHLTQAGAPRFRAARLSFPQMPPSVRLGIHPRADGLGALVDVGTAAPTRVEVRYEDMEFPSRKTVFAVIDALPASLGLDIMSNPAADTLNIQYSATGAVGSIDVVQEEFNVLAATQRSAMRVVRLRGINATRAGIATDRPKHIVFSSNGSIDTVEVALGEGPTEATFPQAVDEGWDYVWREPGKTALRVFGLSRAEVDAADNVLVDVSHRPGPLYVRVVDGPLVVDGSVEDLPGTVRLAFDRPQGRITYNGDAPIGKISVYMRNPAGLFPDPVPPRVGFERVQDVTVTAQGLPNALTLSTATNGGTGITIDANGGTIGVIDAYFKNDFAGWDALPSHLDGLLVRDYLDAPPAGDPRGFTAHLRLTGLKSTGFRTETNCPVGIGDCTNRIFFNMSGNGGRDVVVRMHGKKAASTKDEYLHIHVVQPPPIVEAFVEDRNLVLPPPADIFNAWYHRYLAFKGFEPCAAPSGRCARNAPHLAVATNAGDRHRLDANMTPLPATVDLCMSATEHCAPRPDLAINKGAMSFVASEHTTINVTDCINAACGEYTKVESLRLKTLRHQLRTDSGGVAHTQGSAVIDTDREHMDGAVKLRGADGKRTQLFFGSGFWAEDRVVRWDSPFYLSKGGLIYCSPNTGFYVPTVLDILLNVGGFIC